MSLIKMILYLMFVIFMQLEY